MSLKQEIETWVKALARYDNNEFEEALKTFDDISDTSKILFNCGVIHATIGEHDKAVECYQRAVRLDQYLAVAYFQQGVSNFLVGDFEEALANFNDTLLYLRGNTYIDYEQLGLKFKLFSCEVLFNRGLCYIYLQQKEAGMGDLAYAVKEKVTPDHDVIDEAIKEEADGYTVFSIPVGVVYRPNSAKVKNLKTKDYLGKARLIASSDRTNISTGFAGPENKRTMPPPDTIRDDRLPENISYAASNLVRTDLSSRSRQQSEPPINRNMFPPTPPPEAEQRPPLSTARTSPPSIPSPLTSRADSVRNGSIRSQGSLRNRPPPPERKDSDAISPKSQLPTQPLAPPPPQPQYQPYSQPLQSQPPPPLSHPERPRLGNIRTASEPRGPPSRQNTTPLRTYPSSRGRLFMEAIPSEREGEPGDVAIDEYPDELYDLYRNTAFSNPYAANNSNAQPRRPSSRSRRPSSPGRHHQQQRPAVLNNNDDDASSPSAHSSLNDFEILNDAGGNMSRPRDRDVSRSRGTSRSRRAADVRTIRVKVHLGEDTRYLMIGTTVIFEEFMDRVKEKLGLKGGFKVRVRDEGDLITMGDRDDWDMAVQAVRREARREGGDMGKMEVWVQESTS